VSADVIGENAEGDVRRSSSEVDSPYSPSTLLFADGFAHICYSLSLILLTSTVKV